MTGALIEHSLAKVHGVLMTMQRDRQEKPAQVGGGQRVQDGPWLWDWAPGQLSKQEKERSDWGSTPQHHHDPELWALHSRNANPLHPQHFTPRHLLKESGSVCGCHAAHQPLSVPGCHS